MRAQMGIERLVAPAMTLSSSGEMPSSREETESCRDSSRSESWILSSASWRCSISASAVTAGVTLGLPSRSPPIQEPKVIQRVGALTVG